MAVDHDVILSTSSAGNTRWQLVDKMTRTTGGDCGWLTTPIGNSSMTGKGTATFSFTTTSILYYSMNGTRYSLPIGTYTVGITGSAGSRFIHFDSANPGTLLANVSLPLGILSMHTAVAFIYWDGAAITMISTEFHAVSDGVWHGWAHNFFGCQYYSGLTFTGNVQTDNTTNPADDTVEFLWSTSGVIYDEDTPITIDTTGNWAQVIGSALTNVTAGIFNFLYWDGSKITYRANNAVDSNRYPFIHNGGNTFPYWNNAGALTQAVSDVYVVYHYFASPAVSGDAIFARPHIATFASLALAQAASPSQLTWTNFPLAEVKYIYSAVFRTRTGFNNAVHRCKLVALTSFRASAGSPVAGISATDHQALANRSATGAHPATAISYTPTTAADWDSLNPLSAQDGLDDLASSGVVNTQTANTIMAGPSTGAAALPTFRTLVGNDLAATATLGTFLVAVGANSISLWKTPTYVTSVLDNATTLLKGLLPFALNNRIGSELINYVVNGNFEADTNAAACASWTATTCSQTCTTSQMIGTKCMWIAPAPGGTGTVDGTLTVGDVWLTAASSTRVLSLTFLSKGFSLYADNDISFVVYDTTAAAEVAGTTSLIPFAAKYHKVSWTFIPTHTYVLRFKTTAVAINHSLFVDRFICNFEEEKVANTVLAGPSTGANAVSTYRALVAADTLMTGAGILGRANAGVAQELSLLDTWNFLFPTNIYTGGTTLSTNQIAIANLATALTFAFTGIPAEGLVFMIKNVNDGVLTLSATIDGTANRLLYKYDSMTVKYNGSLGWMIL